MGDLGMDGRWYKNVVSEIECLWQDDDEDEDIATKYKQSI